jgi:hypothetical protein
MLTLQQLKDMKPGTFASGTLVDSPDQINLARTGNTVRWVAVRGGIEDWCIYAQNPHYGNLAWDEYRVKTEGDKITSEANIRKLVECDDEALKMYRY